MYYMLSYVELNTTKTPHYSFLKKYLEIIHIIFLGEG